MVPIFLTADYVENNYSWIMNINELFFILGYYSVN